ncbi:MAG: DsrE family protein [Actinomycetota bacterium]|jgi:hypothetical protein|nr:DsrE family protein [Actinomycetota bacterium]
MAKVVIHLFHADEDSLSAGSHVAERVRQVAGEDGVDLEVYCFGPAQGALGDTSEEPTRAEYNRQIDELVAAGVPVGACLNAARAAGTEQALTERGITLQYARDAYVRFALEGATVLNF